MGVVVVAKLYASEDIMNENVSALEEGITGAKGQT